MNLTRNVGSVTGQAVVSAIITGVMVARGFDISLSKISETPGAADAFLDGWRVAYLLVVGFATAALVAAFMTKEQGSTEKPAGRPSGSDPSRAQAD